MPARRQSDTSEAPPPSSPPSVLTQLGDADSPSEARGVPPSPAQTLWTAHPSPTQTLGHSSPELPPFPTFAILGGSPRTPSTTAGHQPTDSTYYTASWGSPYRNPPPSFNLGLASGANAGPEDSEEESSGFLFGLDHLLPQRLREDDPSNQFSLDHLLPSRLPEDDPAEGFSLEHLLPSLLPPTQLQTPTRVSGTTPEATPRASNFEFPEESSQGSNRPSSEWVQQFLAGGWNNWKNWEKESGNWWSDDSAAESDQEHFSGEDQEPVPEGSQQQERKQKRKKKKRKGHKSRRDNLTVTQHDFWARLSKDQKETIAKMMSSRYADPALAMHSRKSSGSSKTELLPKPMPVAESPLGDSEAVRNRDSTAVPDKPTDHETPVATPTDQGKPELPKESVESLHPASAAAPKVASAPRPRVKLACRGKACWVGIPRDIPRGTPGFPPKPMSAADVEHKMAELERAGYDTRGFGHWRGPADSSEGYLQNRAVWPVEADVQEERHNRMFRVHVPNRAEWEAYEEHLRELKLAALGVALGGEEDSAMSRQTSISQHPGLPFSPPIPTSSAGSHRLRQGSIVSGPFPLGPSPGHISRQSIASPISPFGNPRASMHMHRHSTFASPASFIQQSNSPSGAWSPAGYFSAQDARGASPALPLSRPDLTELVSRSPSFGVRPSQQDDLLAQVQQQKLQAQILQQQQQQLFGIRPSSTLAGVPEDEAEEDEFALRRNASKPAPEITVPTPRSHRHNISANLEREARDAEYHLEEAIDKQFNEGGDFSTEPESTDALRPSNPVTHSNWEQPRQILPQSQPHSRQESIAKPQRPVALGYGLQHSENQQPEIDDGVADDVSDITNPSLDNRDIANGSSHHSKSASQASISWKDSKFGFGKPGSNTHSKHTSRSSISKLNVEAKEFKFNPSASFSPNAFSSGFSFTPATSKPFSPGSTWSSKPSMDSVHSNLNVSAPVFKPDAPIFKPAAEAPVFKPIVANGSRVPSGSFDFSSHGPSFVPSAPVFSPVVPAFTPSQPLPAAAKPSRIFGNINLSTSDIIKPAKRSKAVPIIHPEVVQHKQPEKSLERETQEDGEGRIALADGREKRARRDHGGDGEAVPQFAASPVIPSQPLGEAKNTNIAKQEMPVEQDAVPQDKENLSPKSPEPLSATVVQREEPKVAPAAPTDQSDKLEDSGSDAKTPIDDDTPRGSEAETPLAEEPPKPFATRHRNQSSLSATARPFEFRPQFGSSNFDVGIHVTKPSIAQTEEETDHATPPRHMSRSPATTFRPSDDGSYKTALETGRRVPYAESESVDFEGYGQQSFNDIDAVMKHMDAEGSDFGVERDDPSWEQSSPRRSVHDFERNDLHPNSLLRSDAPSPSPRRYVIQNLNASSASPTHDPFSDGRAGMAYESPVHRLNRPDDVPVSDWDEDIISEGENAVQTRSRFFDSHVDELMSRLLQTRLGPLERNLQDIQDSIALLSERSGRGRRSLSTNERDSDADADDEDDEIGVDTHYRNRSPRKDRKLEKIRSIIKETLESHQPSVTSLPVPVPEPVLPEKLREIVVDALSVHQRQQTQVPEVEPMKPENVRDVIMEALAHHQPQWTPPKFEPVPAEQIRSLIEEAFLSHRPSTPVPVSKSIEPADIKSMLLEALDSHQARHAAPIVEPLQPEAVRAIVSDLLEAYQARNAAPAVEPDTIRSIITEAFEAQKSQTMVDREATSPEVDMAEFYQIVGSLKATVAQAVSGHVQPEEIRDMIEEALARQNAEFARQRESQTIQEKDMRIADLESRLKEANLRVEEETKAREALQAREVNSARLLKVTEEELGLMKEAINDDDNKVRALEERFEDASRELVAYRTADSELRNEIAALTAANEELRLRSADLESAELDAKKKLSAAAAENEALQFTLKEYRISSDKWREEIQQAKEEKDRLRQAIEATRVQAEESTRVREAMRSKLEKLQQDMIVASGQAAAERAQWQKSDETHMKKYEVLSARIEAEGRTRERLERELERLETQEREGMKLKVALEQTQKHNARLEEIIKELRHETIEHQKAAERWEREFKEAREAGRIEVRRTRVLMEADIDAANNQVNIVRADLESEIARLRQELDNVRLDTDTTKAKHELDLEAASDAKKQAVMEVMESKKRALLEQQQAFDRQIELLKKEHAKVLDIAREDQQRAEAYHKDRLSLSDSKLEHLQDKIAHLEEKLSVAKEAANAAIQAAQNAKVSSSTQSSSSGSGAADKISPQALRESIAVLQEQLQERESRIESLEQQLSELDTDAPAKLKERDTEIGWLRELLGVRIDDLNDLINALAQPVFDRDAVRDAAIRIRTNLQMEQHEKERLATGSQTFPTLATLSNFASPKAVQLAAAFGNWRKGREHAASSLGKGSSNSSSRTPTPSRTMPTATAQSFLSGLMTPPTSNMRRTPEAPSQEVRLKKSRSNSSNSVAGFPGLGKQPVPATPPLMRKTSYDQDAEDGHFSESGFYDDESTVDGDVTPIGLNFGQELRR